MSQMPDDPGVMGDDDDPSGAVAGMMVAAIMGFIIGATFTAMLMTFF